MENIINTKLETNVGQVIYAGAGNAPNMEWLRSMSFEQLQLIEPVESIAKKLSKKYESANVTVQNVAISNVTGVCDFSFMHPTKYSSLKSEINLKNVLKNSKVVEVKTIQTISLSELIRNAQLDQNKSNILILSINGSELDCLSSVTQKELIQFSIIIVQIESKGIYNNAFNEKNNPGDNLTNVKSVLKKNGFYIEDIKVDGAIFTTVTFKRNDEELSKISTLNRRVEKLEKSNEELLGANNAEKTKSKNFEKQHKDSINNLQAENIELKAFREEGLEEINILSINNRELQQENAKVNANILGLKEQLQKQSDLYLNCKELSESLRQQLATSETDRNQLEGLINSIQAENIELKAFREEGLEEINILSINNKELQQENAKVNANILGGKEQLQKQSDLYLNCKNLSESLEQQLTISETDRQKQKNIINDGQIEIAELKVLSLELQEKFDRFQIENEESKTARDKHFIIMEREKNQEKETISQIQVEASELKSRNRIQHQKIVDLEQQNKLIEVKQSDTVKEVEQLQQANLELTNKCSEKQKSDKWAKSLNSQVLLLNEELKERNRSANLGQKMLVKAHTDLDHLRESYSVKLTSEMALVDLVKELREKLTLASKYYYQLQQEHPELLSSADPVIAEDASHNNGGQ
jgi:hypothetical protein